MTHYAWAFLGTTTLTFLGLAGDPALPEWGAMLDGARTYLVQFPLQAHLPGLLISLTVLAFHQLGERAPQPIS
jgi:peptide/nickel transport system permease protein